MLTVCRYTRRKRFLFGDVVYKVKYLFGSPTDRKQILSKPLYCLVAQTRCFNHSFLPAFRCYSAFPPRGFSAVLGRCWGTYAPTNHANFDFNHPFRLGLTAHRLYRLPPSRQRHRALFCGWVCFIGSRRKSYRIPVAS